MSKSEDQKNNIENALLIRFIKGGLTLATAESCTGGSIAARLTRIPGASKYYLGGVIAYSNALKRDVLGVSEETLQAKGAVSEEVVVAMARGVLTLTGADYGIAVSGIAGPEGGTPEKPIGTVWGAIGNKNNMIYSWKFQAYGNREEIIESSADRMLSELLRITDTGSIKSGT